jgi:hypothetical protein
VLVVSRAVGIKMESVKVDSDKVIFTGKRKDLFACNGFKFRLQKNYF